MVLCTITNAHLCLRAPFWLPRSWKVPTHWICTDWLWTQKKVRELGSFHCSLKTSCANSSGACKCSVIRLKVMQWPLPLLLCQKLCQKGINKEEENICQGWFYPSGPVFRGGFWSKEYLCKLMNSEGISKALLAARFAGESHLEIKAADRPWLHMLLYQSQLPALCTSPGCTAFKLLHQWSGSRACCEHSIIETHQESYSTRGSEEIQTNFLWCCCSCSSLVLSTNCRRNLQNNTGSTNPNCLKKRFLLLVRSEWLPECPVFSSRRFCHVKKESKDKLLRT